MKILKWLVYSIITFIILVSGFAYLQPTQYSVSRTTVIHAPAAKIYALIASPQEWKRWSVWNRRDPQMLMQYSGPAMGSGAAWEWQSKSQGNGGMKFTEAIPDQKISYELHFDGMGKPSAGALTLTPDGDKVNLSWTMQGSNEGNFMMKLFTPFMDKMIGGDFAAGLENLKQIAETP